MSRRGAGPWINFHQPKAFAVDQKIHTVETDERHGGREPMHDRGKQV